MISEKGFTLIETLIAVTILATAIAGPLTIAAKSFMAATVVKDQITAFYLAQDAIEYVRYKRDSNKLCLAAGSTTGVCLGVTSWLSRLTNCISAGGTQACNLDSTENSVTPPTLCPTPTTCTVMRYDDANNRFTYSGGTQSTISLRRAVIIATPVGTNAGEASITVTVSWSDQAGITRSVVVRENIFNWQ